MLPDDIKIFLAGLVTPLSALSTQLFIFFDELSRVFSSRTICYDRVGPLVSCGLSEDRLNLSTILIKIVVSERVLMHEKLLILDLCYSGIA